MSLLDAAGDGLTEKPGGGAVASDGAILQPPMQLEEGFALREWRRKNAIRLEEKEIQEKESVKQIIATADEYKAEFNRKWKARCHNNITINRDKEKSYLESREKFHAEASNNYFKAITEMIPKEVPKLEKRGKKAEEKQASVVIVQGPKPGKPTDLSRMRQILVNLKHNTPLHMKPQKDTKTDLGPPKPVDVTSA